MVLGECYYCGMNGIVSKIMWEMLDLNWFFR